MPYANLRQQPIEDLVNSVQGFAAMASQTQVQSVAALGARLTIELADNLKGLSDSMFNAKKQLVERLDALGQEIRTAQIEMAKGSAEASRHSKTMAEWTRVLVVVTGLYTLISFGLLLTTILRRWEGYENRLESREPNIEGDTGRGH